MFKRYALLTLLFILVLVLAACGGNSAPASGGASDPVAAGEKLFNETSIGGNPGCITCHSLKPGEVKVGPSMAGIATDAAEEAASEGMSTEEMLKEMIVEPNAEIAGGFQANIMPDNWGEKLTAQQLDDLVAFLMTLK